MCYSKDWMANDERRQREAAKVKEAKAKCPKRSTLCSRKPKAGHAFRLFQSARGRPCKVNPEHTGILTCLATKRPTGRFCWPGLCACCRNDGDARFDAHREHPSEHRCAYR